MAERGLIGRTILIVEDEYFLAMELEREVGGAGAIVVGPAASLNGAIDLIEAGTHLDGAILDTNLRGEMVFPLAVLLRERGVPFLFATGYDPRMIPPEFQDIERLEKPIDLRRLVVTVSRLLEKSGREA